MAGQEIRGLRIARGWSQQEVAVKMRGFGYTWNQTMVSKIEAGTRPLRVNELADLAQLFAVPVAQLLLPQVSLEEAEKEIAELEPALQAAEAKATTAEADLRATAEQAEQVSYELNRIRARLDYLRRRRDSLKPVGIASPREAGLQPVVAAIVTSELGVLVGRRNDGKPPWTFIAGEQDAVKDENPADTAVREVKEETGLRVTAGDVIGERVHPKTGRTMIYIAAAPIHGTDVVVNDEDELAEVRWLGLAEADQLLPGMYEPVREHLARELGGG